MNNKSISLSYVSVWLAITNCMFLIALSKSFANKVSLAFDGQTSFFPPFLVIALHFQVTSWPISLHMHKIHEDFPSPTAPTDL